MVSVAYWARCPGSVPWSVWHTRTLMIGVGGVLLTSWAFSCLAPLFSLSGGFVPPGERSSPASNAGTPTIVEASTSRLPACLLEEGNPGGPQETWGSSLLPFSLGPDCGKGDWCGSPEAPAQALLNCPAKLLCAAIF